MRRLIVAGVLVAGFGGMLLVGAVFTLLGGSGGSSGWDACSATLGPWGEGAGRGARQAGALGPQAQGIAGRIIAIGQQRQLPPRAWQIALQAGKTESGLRNISGGDRDSIGVFQMRPSKGWGTVAQLHNLEYQINTFYDHLSAISDWQRMRPGQAAQAVERSAFPLRYRKWEGMAASLVSGTGSVGSVSGCEDLPSSTTLATKAIDFANAQIGKPYVWGAAGPQAFDCSGLTMRAWQAAGVRIPKYSQDQYFHGGRQVPVSQAQRGDLIFWGTGRDPRAIHHVALYLGDNQVLQAPQPGENVERRKMWDGGQLLPMAVRPVPDQHTRTAAAGAAGPDSTPHAG